MAFYITFSEGVGAGERVEIIVDILWNTGLKMITTLVKVKSQVNFIMYDKINHSLIKSTETISTSIRKKNEIINFHKSFLFKFNGIKLVLDRSIFH